MNNREKNVMTEVKVMIAELKVNSKWIKKNIKEHNDKLDNINSKIIKIDTGLNNLDTGFKNHLKHHENMEKQATRLDNNFYRKITIIIAIAGIGLPILVTILLKLIFP